MRSMDRPGLSPAEQLETARRTLQALADLRERLIALNAKLEYTALMLRLDAAGRRR